MKNVRRGGLTPSRVVSALMGQRSALPPPAAAEMQQHGHERIVRLWVRREPLPHMVDAAVELLSLGNWSASKKAVGYKHVFHVMLVMHLQNADDGRLSEVVLEKAPTVLIREKPRQVDSQDLHVPLRSPIYLHDFLRRAVRIYGSGLWNYESKANNCQDFVVKVLAAWGLLTPQIHRFVKQSTDVLLASPWTHMATNVVADAAVRTDILVHGCRGPNCFSTLSNPFTRYLPPITFPSSSQW